MNGNLRRRDTNHPLLSPKQKSRTPTPKPTAATGKWFSRTRMSRGRFGIRLGRGIHLARHEIVGATPVTRARQNAPASAPEYLTAWQPRSFDVKSVFSCNANERGIDSIRAVLKNAAIVEGSCHVEPAT